MTTSRVSLEEWDALLQGTLGVRRPVSVVHLRGPDARRFANGMFTNNVRDLAAGCSNRHAMVSDRGRVGGFLDLACLANDHFVAVLDGVDSAAFCERYETYVVFDDVELVPEDWVSIWVGGPGASSWQPAAEPIGVGFPVKRLEGGGFAMTTFGWPTPAVRWAVPPPDEGAIVADLADTHWAEPDIEPALRLLAGMPRFPEDTGEKGLPHELGLREQLLNFEKGCYLGQESINRIDVMGNVRRHLRVLRLAEAVPAGTAVTHGGTAVGTLSTVVQLPSAVLGWSVLKEAAQEPGTVVQVGEQEATVLASPLSTDDLPGQ